MTSPIISDNLKLNTPNYDIPELMQPVSADSDDSGLSDTEVIEISLPNDLDYQETLPTTTTIFSHSITSTTYHKRSTNIMLPPPPPRPAHFSCEPAWHYDTAKSPVNSDGEEVESSDTEDSEDGAIPEFSLKKGKGKKRRKSPAKKKQEESYKKTKAADKLEGIQRVEVAEFANFHALRRRSRGRQPPSHFQHLPEEVRSWYYCFTLKQVQKGLIIHDSKKRVLVHLFPLATIPSNLIETLATSFEEYDNSITFPNYNYTHKRGDYQVRILGCWFKSERFLQPYMTAHYHGPHSGIHYKRSDNPHYIAAKRFQKTNKNLFQLVEDLIKHNYPELWEIYDQIKVPAGRHKFAGLFAALAINKMVQTKVHKDLGDIKGGICVLICWGKFHGGELVFTELRACVPFPAGSLIMFRSAIISHYNMPVEGDRYSMVFMTDKNLYKWSQSQSQF